MTAADVRNGTPSDPTRHVGHAVITLEGQDLVAVLGKPRLVAELHREPIAAEHLRAGHEVL